MSFEATTDELTEAFDQLSCLVAATTRHLLKVIAEADAQELWRSDGCRSMVDWVAMRAQVSSATARRYVRVAEALESLPLLDAALSRGEVSFDQVVPLCELATPDTEAMWLGELGFRSVAQLEVAARLRRGTTRENEVAAKRKRSLRFKPDPRDDDMRLLFGRLPNADAAVVEAAIARLAEQAPKDPDTGGYEPYGARCADALVQLAGATLAADRDPDRATVVIHTDAETLSGIEGGMAETQDGLPLAMETVQRLACACRWQLLAEGPDGCVRVGHSTYTPPWWMARRIRRRDRGCRFPGCSATLGIQIHHIVHWPVGATDEDNLVSLCFTHHHLVHEGGWSIRGDPRHAVEFVRPDGSVPGTGPPGLRDDIARRIFGPDAA